MKINITIFLSVMVLLVSCSKKEYIVEDSNPTVKLNEQKKVILLKFPKLNLVQSTKNPVLSSISLYWEVEANLYKKEGKWILESDDLEEVEFTDSKTGKKSYGYAYSKKMKTKSAVVDNQDWSIKTGLYGFNGLCFIWGTLYTDANGNEIFVPADYSTQLLLNLCPSEGSLFAKTNIE